jgi:dTDP-4-dehydrorhamnose 3,5-epimerase
VVVVEPEVHRDDRGYFLENYHREHFAQAGLPDEFVQDNHSRSRHKVLRGIHLQDWLAPMGKLVRCTSGSILDVAVDLRVGSPTFGKWVKVELSQENLRELMVPAGFGHAFLTLSEWADVQYKCTGYYSPPAERTIAWNDPEIGIDWPIPDPIVSAKDARGMSLREYGKNPAFEYERPGLRHKP